MIWVWTGIIVLALIVEFLTADLISIWFSISGIPALLFEVFGLPLWSQILVFVVMSAILLLFTRKFLRRILNKNPNNDIGTAGFIGKKVKLSGNITILTHGEVTINGVVWTAIGVNEDINDGTIVEIIGIQGNKLIVKKEASC